MKEAMYFIRRAFGLIVVSSILFLQSGCSSTVFLGYLNTSSDYLDLKPIHFKSTDDYMKIGRDPFNNTFDIRISSKFNDGALNSLDINYEVLLIFSSAKKVPKSANPTIYSPTFYSRNISIEKVNSDLVNNKAIVTLKTNELGRDLLLTSFTTPFGVQGYFTFDSEILLFKANLIEESCQTSKVYLSKDLFGNYLRIESTVEYPVSFICHFNISGKKKEKIKTVIVNPWESQEIKIPSDFDLAKISSVKIEKQLIYNSPLEFKQ